MTDRVDACVIGAGVVGLAVARHLARAGREVIILEREAAIGGGVSSRNSEVIHAGIYYPPGSVKAALCVRGRDLLYDYCRSHGVPFRPTGKLIVATSDTQLSMLGAIASTAAQNGVRNLQPLDAGQVNKLEPALRSCGALLSPSTGIVDSHALMLSLQGDAEDAGAVTVFASPVSAAHVGSGGITVEVGGRDPMRLSCRILVNAASLDAPALARRIEGLAAAAVPKAYLCKGSYFSLSGRAPFSRLIYPVVPAGHAGLGVHLTLDLAGRARFGPDVEWVDREDYDVDPARSASFYEAIRTYWPGLRDGALVPAYAGLRPKISAPGAVAADFMISGPEHHGVAGLVNLFGIESPGLTASLAIAEDVERMLLAA
ncbi:L-2-hydroxyglutarate oxidase LhgO [Rhodoligotrophos appendicifer]|uniref:NAD(P)/FAD-dependent oxidoreductase n=1 Tax=Rhodoligotrophos appendicifer TaxID=987056 RepID=UPI001184C4F3|nr:NAD(P)/FAD-dependent oxidoreductase [Rhodoligotrophos appendicifer]